MDRFEFAFILPRYPKKYITLETEESPSMKRNRPGQDHAELTKGPDVYTFHFHLQISITYVHSIPEHNLALFWPPPQTLCIH